MVPVQGHEFVAHVFVAAGGPQVAADYRYLAGLWRRCAAEFAIDQPVDPYPSELPGTGPVVGEDEELVAVRSRRAGGLHQLAVRRVHDVLCLSVVLAPDPAPGWTELESRWESLLAPPTRGVLGSVRILQARLSEPGAVPGVGAPPRDAVGEWGRGALRAEPPLGPFAVWEAAGGADARADRRVVVVAAADRDPQLSAWTWSRGDGALTPFARYLLHAAKVRFELRVRAANQGTALQRSAEEAAAQLRSVVVAGRSTDPEDAVKLAALRAAEVRLTYLVTWTCGLRESVRIAAGNMAAHAHGDQAAGLFADDRGVAAWLDRQLGHDLTYAKGALERVRSVVAAAERLVPARPGTPHRAVRLTGGQKRALIDALADAYPTYEDLAMLLDLRLERRLTDFSPVDAMPAVVWRLIGEAERLGFTRDLITAAVAGNPGNPALQELEASGLLGA